MNDRELNGCGYTCNEHRHTTICLGTVDNCKWCGHALLAHKKVPKFDRFKVVREQVRQEVSGDGIQQVTNIRALCL